MEYRDSIHQDLIDAFARVPEHVVFRTFADETLLLNLDSGQYHGLNPTGGRLIELIGGEGRPVREAIELLAEEYAMPAMAIEADMLEFCSELEQRGLIAVERGD